MSKKFAKYLKIMFKHSYLKPLLSHWLTHIEILHLSAMFPPATVSWPCPSRPGRSTWREAWKFRPQVARKGWQEGGSQEVDTNISMIKHDQIYIYISLYKYIYHVYLPIFLAIYMYCRAELSFFNRRWHCLQHIAKEGRNHFYAFYEL